MQVCKCDSQKEADKKLPELLKGETGIVLLLYPVKESVNIEKYLKTGKIYQVVCGGDESESMQLCKHQWIEEICSQCKREKTWFRFFTTGSVYEKEGHVYHVPAQVQRLQAKKAELDYDPYKDVFDRLKKSDFRQKFHLTRQERDYVRKKGYEEIEIHARQFVQKRIAPYGLENDGRQTPMRGHPVFKAQHATATCCRGCIEKWHKITKDHPLTEKEIHYITIVIMKWIILECKNKI